MTPVLFLLNLCNRLSIYFSTLKSKAKLVFRIVKQAMQVGELYDILKVSFKLRVKDDGPRITQKLFYSTFTPRNPNQPQLIPPAQEIKKTSEQRQNKLLSGKADLRLMACNCPSFKPQALKDRIPTAGASRRGAQEVLSFCLSDVSLLHAFSHIPLVRLAF